MKLLSDLLFKYRNLVPTDSLKKEAVMEVIAKCFKINLEKKDISIANNIIYLKTSTKLKAEVFMHKAAILRDLKEILTKNAPLKAEVFMHKAAILRDLKEILTKNAPKDIR